MVNVGTTKIYKNNQTTIPSKIRKEFNITEDTIIDWELNSDKTITLTFKSKKSSIMDLVALGKSKERTNAVELKRGLYK
ncbi:AbrB/MazE/SpoVT family DNA-binding domain-containing protein [uncultured Methanobrevibacter sp.]|uniref:AbrB/MazE/SpoVT family DNA-binding domain-containing protein n=1 Tax=uncultured Methanobrevibacter sp. TaxID=253161 RepID=UPI0025F47C90|nr:AbrB/MazE/SpoVT family DNA-binding domain-containing protein [uncultured Methanobrevibacter sp.]